jgi:multidrug efflux pump
VLLLGTMGYLFTTLPTSFLPEEDQGAFLAMVQLPAGATQERTNEVLAKVRQHFEVNEKESVESVFTIAGFSFAGSGQNMGMAFIRLKDWQLRQRPDQYVTAVVGRAMGAFMQFKEARAFAFNLPAIRGLGTSSGFDFYLQDNGGLGHEALVAARNQFLGMASQDPSLTGVRPNGMEDAPQYRLDIDFEKAMALGVTVSDINATLSTAWGSRYLNDFVHNGRIKKVYLQADAQFRMQPEDIGLWYVRNNKGEMVPFSAFTRGHWEMGSPRLERFNGRSALEIVGQGASGVSSGEAMAVVAGLVAKLPTGVGYSWTGTSYQEQLSGSQTNLLYALSFLTVFLCLAALYESWSVPLSVMLAVPLGILGALAAAYFRGLDNDVYFQVGLLTTMGLSAKNAILIVEFAKSHFDDGMSLLDATIEACKLRLRPILMTSLAFMLGVLPLAISTGAGANSRHAIGTGVLGGMFSATVLAIFFIPLFFVVVMKVFNIRQRSAQRVEIVESVQSEL